MPDHRPLDRDRSPAFLGRKIFGSEPCPSYVTDHDSQNLLDSYFHSKWAAQVRTKTIV